MVILPLTSCHAISTVDGDIHCDIIAIPEYSMTKKLCNLRKHRSRWSHQVSAMVTNQWLQCDQTLPRSAKSVACQARYEVLVLSQQRYFRSTLPPIFMFCLLSVHSLFCRTPTTTDQWMKTMCSKKDTSNGTAWNSLIQPPFIISVSHNLLLDNMYIYNSLMSSLIPSLIPTTYIGWWEWGWSCGVFDIVWCNLIHFVYMCMCSRVGVVRTSILEPVSVSAHVNMIWCLYRKWYILWSSTTRLYTLNKSVSILWGKGKYDHMTLLLYETFCFIL